MSSGKEIAPGQKRETRSSVTEQISSADLHVPRKMSFGENVILTVKVLAGFGLLGAVLWGINLLVSPN